MQKKIKIEAKEVSEAINKGLRQLKLRRDQVDISILQHPKKGFLGIGARAAVVELRPKRWSTADLDAQIYMDVPKRKSGSRGDKNRSGRSAKNTRGNRRRNTAAAEARTHRTERTPKANEPQRLPCEAIQNAVIPDYLKGPMQEAKDYLGQVLTHMGIKVENLNVWWDEKQQRILLTFDCDQPAIVIGKEGKTLEAIQYLCTLSLSRHFDKPISVITDTQNYWRKAEDKLNEEIEHGISLIKSGHSVFRFRPMPAQLRRYIHRALEGNEYAVTASEGEGKWRKVTLRPTEKATECLQANKAPADFVPGVIGEDKPEEQPAESAVSDVTVTVDAVTAQETVKNGVTVEETSVVETVTLPQSCAEKCTDNATGKPQENAADCGPLFAQTPNTESK